MGIQALLMAFCDAMVQVSSDSVILNDASRLSAMLFRQPLNGSLQGGSFLELLHPEDRPRVLAFLGSVRPMEPTGTISVRLLDARNCAVQVQLYFTCFTGLEGQRQYLVGICESSAAFRDSCPEILCSN